MTDAEKELRRLAWVAATETTEENWKALVNACSPGAVLALLDRIEALEKSQRCEHGDEREYCAKAFNEAVDRAERKGAEEMRDRAANEVQSSGDIADLAETHGYRELEALVRSIPLPGDAP